MTSLAMLLLTEGHQEMDREPQGPTVMADQMETTGNIIFRETPKIWMTFSKIFSAICSRAEAVAFPEMVMAAASEASAVMISAEILAAEASEEVMAAASADSVLRRGRI